MSDEPTEIILAQGIRETGEPVDVPRGAYKLKLFGGPLNGAVVIPQMFCDDAWTAIPYENSELRADALPRTYTCSFPSACTVRIAIGAVNGKPEGVSALLQRK